MILRIKKKSKRLIGTHTLRTQNRRITFSLSREYFSNIQPSTLHVGCPRFHLRSRYSSFEFSVLFDGEEDGAITRDGDNSRFSRSGKNSPEVFHARECNVHLPD
jgi:hypothetical protein